MRLVLAGAGVTALLLLVGCNHWPHNRGSDRPAAVSTTRPTSQQLVGYLNANAQRVPGIESREVYLDVKNPQVPGGVGLQGVVFCQKPRDFRLIGKVAGSSEVDIGSNSQEFWFWIKRAEPSYLYHCSYDDYRKGVQLPFPFQPEWLLEAMGMADYDPAKTYEVVEKQATIELVERTTSAQGQQVRKVTVFNRAAVAAGRPQITAYLVQDANGKEICSAYISDWYVDSKTQAVVPRGVRLVWPEQQTELKMQLKDMSLTAIDAQRARGLFSRDSLKNLQAFDLGRTVRRPVEGVQRVGGPGDEPGPARPLPPGDTR